MCLYFSILFYQEFENWRIESSEGGLEMIEWMRLLTHYILGYYRQLKTIIPLPILTHSAPLLGFSFNPLENIIEKYFENLRSTKVICLSSSSHLITYTDNYWGIQNMGKKNKDLKERLFWNFLYPSRTPSPAGTSW